MNDNRPDWASTKRLPLHTGNPVRPRRWKWRSLPVCGVSRWFRPVGCESTDVQKPQEPAHIEQAPKPPTDATNIISAIPKADRSNPYTDTASIRPTHRNVASPCRRARSGFGGDNTTALTGRSVWETLAYHIRKKHHLKKLSAT